MAAENFLFLAPSPRGTMMVYYWRGGNSVEIVECFSGANYAGKTVRFPNEGKAKNYILGIAR